MYVYCIQTKFNGEIKTLNLGSFSYYSNELSTMKKLHELSYIVGHKETCSHRVCSVSV